ncbi:ATP-binding cassette domain-containing protein, partial [Klebsiella pneumoniae]|uniref:ATP-binding cassette domain-containing protein n=1 Tax=Klebsiella pneumoniae TaxID=573 RepID=UPI002730A16F
DGRLSAVLKGLSLQVPERSINAVVGPSGAGKSTLARCITLLEQPDSGSIRINGLDLSALSGEALRRERRAIGTVFQSAALLSRRTAWAQRWSLLAPGPRRLHQRSGSPAAGS